ncbi:hypothetical protein BDN71DRAFT_1454914 [Pleurotus eryngii]|uniref:Uncharacterized protein n=1 Tax=Pleurotus eryngii TaxID=5323 RepID=A0A9P5ZMN0_PLEER|nr:hypothetical protein BDN71DRAFT_1454914 [Pleurotus eryngii]
MLLGMLGGTCTSLRANAYPIQNANFLDPQLITFMFIPAVCVPPATTAQMPSRVYMHDRDVPPPISSIVVASAKVFPISMETAIANHSSNGQRSHNPNGSLRQTRRQSIGNARPLHHIRTQKFDSTPSNAPSLATTYHAKRAAEITSKTK